MDDMLDNICQFGQDVSQTPGKVAGLLDDAGNAVAGIFRSAAGAISESVDELVDGMRAKDRPRRRSIAYFHRRRSIAESRVDAGLAYTSVSDPLGLRNMQTATVGTNSTASAGVQTSVLGAEEEESARRAHRRGRRKSWQMGAADLEGCKALSCEVPVDAAVTPENLPIVRRIIYELGVEEEGKQKEDEKPKAVVDRTRRNRRKSWQWGIGDADECPELPCHPPEMPHLPPLIPRLELKSLDYKALLERRLQRQNA
eukprot:TRINITY_DN4281_c0_g1_i1.p1 TRINITY_DN4281_c0_g1~~TRINITY_DN4281_c0_g1_i1.p1  ORF type:complete len:256 (-),score=51.63 TRINITY_DN4281_c0_g1_i1:273-1040(-)